MSEHPRIDKIGYEQLTLEMQGDLRFENIVRVRNHLLHSPDHSHQGFAVLYEGGESPQKLWDGFEQEFLSHKAAILRGEITTLELWPNSLE